MELRKVAATGGNDPSLDELLVDFGIATGARPGAIPAVVVGDLHPRTQMICLGVSPV